MQSRVFIFYTPLREKNQIQVLVSKYWLYYYIASFVILFYYNEIKKISAYTIPYIFFLVKRFYYL
jgi:hypothetical protein